ncbi:jg3698 [Pararge aegeria aegeria]|uniref:Jg3698 protein n=1 Tax=Pararge aegeria aegeria TaxID=348720 RepID=A0A8S4S5W7_9NEOP|nr:jg3698 [Pararge aegeria aegeria]
MARARERGSDGLAPVPVTPTPVTGTPIPAAVIPTPVAVTPTPVAAPVSELQTAFGAIEFELAIAGT